MHIHDFYSKLTSVTEEGHLFQALRNLSRVENPQSIIDGEDTILGEWTAWPPVDSATACLATGVI
jgi:hypothetical protein